MDASNVPNRISQFCENAPAPTVLRAKVGNGIEVERVYGSPAPPAETIAKHFKENGDSETLLVSVSKDGNVLGTSWPVFREKVSLELGIPDMNEAEAASLLLSPKCKDELRAFRDRGVRPAAAEPTSTRGCARCDVGPEGGLHAPEVVIAFAMAAIWARRRPARPGPRGAGSGNPS
jgi:hypothetical protein